MTNHAWPSTATTAAGGNSLSAEEFKHGWRLRLRPYDGCRYEGIRRIPCTSSETSVHTVVFHLSSRIQLELRLQILNEQPSDPLNLLQTSLMVNKTSNKSTSDSLQGLSLQARPEACFPSSFTPLQGQDIILLCRLPLTLQIQQQSAKFMGKALRQFPVSANIIQDCVTSFQHCKFWHWEMT